jgi:hypothetical protein
MVDSAVPAFSARGGRWINAAGFVEFEHVLLLPPCVSVASAQTHGALVFVPIWSCLERRVCDGTRSRSSSADRGRGGGCCHCCYPAHSPGSREIRVPARVVRSRITTGHSSSTGARTGEGSPHFHRGNPSAVTHSPRARGVLRCDNGSCFAPHYRFDFSRTNFSNSTAHATTTEKACWRRDDVSNRWGR